MMFRKRTRIIIASFKVIMRDRYDIEGNEDIPGRIFRKIEES